MWLFLKNARLSVVAHRDEPQTLIVRSRRRDELTAALAFLPDVEIHSTPDHDYAFRAFVDRREFARLVAREVETIDYDNFKGAITDIERASCCHDVWRRWLMGHDDVTKLAQQLAIDPNLRERIGDCPVCNKSVRDLKVVCHAEMVRDLHRVYRWCGANKCHEFTMKDVRHLLGKVSYTNFGKLIHFGGVLYRPEGKGPGHFGLNMERAADFFAGKRRIPKRLTRNAITQQTEEADYALVGEFPDLKEMLDADGNYDARRA